MIQIYTYISINKNVFYTFFYERKWETDLVSHPQIKKRYEKRIAASQRLFVLKICVQLFAYLDLHIFPEPTEYRMITDDRRVL